MEEDSKRPLVNDSEPGRNTKRSRINQLSLYRHYFSVHEYEVENGPMTTNLHSSHISTGGNSGICPELVGTRWLGSEKEVFFEFLGRYGIAQVDKMQKKLPEKSIVEIMNYYNLLKTALESYKATGNTTRVFIKYADIPEAMEMDGKAEKVEEQLAYHRPTHKAPPVTHGDDNEDKIINGESLATFLEIWNAERLKFPRLRQIVLTKETLDELEIMIRAFIRRVLTTMITLQLHAGVQPALAGDILSFPAHKQSVYMALLKLRTGRPLNMFYSYKLLTRRANMRPEPDPSKEQVMEFPDGEIRSPKVRDFMENMWRPKELKDKHHKENHALDSDSASDSDFDSESDSDNGSFITQEMAEEFCNETNELDRDFDKAKQGELFEYIEQIGGLDYYHSLVRGKTVEQDPPLKAEQFCDEYLAGDEENIGLDRVEGEETRDGHHQEEGRNNGQA